MSKTTQLTAEEWKQLCLLGVAQLNTFVQQIAVPPTGEHFALIDSHLERWRTHMGAWAASKVVLDPVPPQQAVRTAPAGNGAEPPKKKGGWPLGKKRKPKAQSEAVQ